ncbi:MAG TPA: hypothetical protein VN285_01410 [Candidatus Deferrimicrobium sp.]|nr:hypothetical protein [Candidatus Deferrimicrobium sp.]
MFGLKDLSVNLLSSSLAAVVLALLLLVMLGVYLYYRTNPPLPARVRVLLGAFRLLAVVGLLIALFEPVVSITREFRRTPRIALLLDHSASMDKTEAGKSRQIRLDSLLSSAAFGRLQTEAEVEPHYFGGNLVESRSGVDRDRTALGEALYQLEQAELAKPSDWWMLLSDGRWNAGREPVSVIGGQHAPLITVDLATTSGNLDVAVSDIVYNPILFVGQPTEINAKLIWQSALDRDLRIELRDSGKVVETQALKVTQETGMGDVALTYMPTEPGQQLLEVYVPPLAGEETIDNNRRTFAVKVLKSRLSVLLVSGHPDYEVGFLKRFLQQSGKFELDLVVTGPKAGNLSAGFPSRQSELNRYDLIILHDPDPNQFAAHHDILRSYLNQRGGAIWVLMGKQFAGGGPSEWVAELLPFYPSRAGRIQHRSFNAQPSEGDLFHPAVRLADDQSAIRETWSQLPPFQSLVVCDITHEQAVILAQVNAPGPPEMKAPVLGFRRFGAGKIFACAALPFWPWGFVNRGIGGDESRYGAFVDGVVSWLTVRDDLDPIRIAPQKDVYTRGEPVTFDGFAFDLGYRPIPGATGNVRLERSERVDTLETDLLQVGEGTYRGIFYNLEPGNYHYTATFEKEGRLLKQAEGNLLIEAFSLEEFDQRGDPATMDALARLTGGGHFSYEDFDRAVGSIKLTHIEHREQSEHVLYNQLWLMAIVIGALSVEWVLRKAFQLV